MSLKMRPEAGISPMILSGIPDDLSTASPAGAPSSALPASGDTCGAPQGTRYEARTYSTEAPGASCPVPAAIPLRGRVQGRGGAPESARPRLAPWRTSCPVPRVRTAHWRPVRVAGTCSTEVRQHRAIPKSRRDVAYIQYGGPGKLPCASGTYSSQEAGTGYACGLRKARELCVSRGRYPGRGGGQRASQHVSARELLLLLLLLRSPGARPRLGRVGRQLQRRHRRQAQEKRDVHDSFAAALRHHHASKPSQPDFGERNADALRLHFLGHLLSFVELSFGRHHSARDHALSRHLLHGARDQRAA